MTTMCAGTQSQASAWMLAELASEFECREASGPEALVELAREVERLARSTCRG